MFVHSVVFYLKKNMTPEQITAFEKGAQSLTTIKSVAHGWVGKPAQTDREIIQKDYDYLLTIVNETYEKQMEYQDDPIHDAFRDNFAQFFDKVVIYDAE